MFSHDSHDSASRRNRTSSDAGEDVRPAANSTPIPVHRVIGTDWVAWLPSVLQALSIGRATMVTEQITELVRDRRGAASLQAWASGPSDPSPIWTAGGRRQPRGLIVAMVPPEGGSATILCAGLTNADPAVADSTVDDWIPSSSIPTRSTPANSTDETAPAASGSGETDRMKTLTRHLSAILEHATDSWSSAGIDLLYWSGDAGESLGFRGSLGFQDLAQMHYRSADIDALAATDSDIPHPVGQTDALMPTRLRRCDFDDPASRNLLVDVVRQSYLESADCPAINRYRGPETTLRGYRDSPQYESSLWFEVLAADSEDPIGVAIGSLHPAVGGDQTDQNPSGEIVYLGLTPPFRGRGWARSIVTQMVDKFRNHQCGRVWVAHDAANTAAAKLYQSMGFATIYRQQMWFRPLRPNA